MACDLVIKPTFRARIQHYLLNWILAARYTLVHRGIPKAVVLHYLTMFETLLKKINILT